MSKHLLAVSPQTQVGEILKNILSDTYLLYTKTQNFHWNVVGAQFYSLHKLFEKHYEELAEALDVIAEHIRTLDIRVPGAMRSFLDLGSIQESDESLDSLSMIQQLLEDHETLGRLLRQYIETIDQLGDEATVDLLIDRLRSHDKMAWMLRSLTVKS